MNFMEGKKLLYAQVFNGRQKLLKLSLQTFFQWIFCFFSHFHTCSDLKRIRYSTSFCCKNDSQFDRKKELQAIRDERGWFFVCYILDIHYTLNSISHWIAWTHSKYMKWWSRPFNKGKILAPNRLNILTVFLYWVQKSRVEKDNNQS